MKSRAENWGELYNAALFEVDDERLSLCIAEAERALLHREQELFATSSSDPDEPEALSDALYALQALRSCLELRTRSTRAA